jgi:hypothetical protein
LNAVPRGILYDETYNGLDILRILTGELPIFLTGNYGREALFIYRTRSRFTSVQAFPTSHPHFARRCDHVIIRGPPVDDN